jgi:membrane dipeptidase
MLRYLLSTLCLLLLLSSCQSYKNVHKNAILIDTHNDVLSSVTMKAMSIEQDLTGKAQSDIARFKKGGVDIQVFSIFCDEQFGKDTAFKFANIEIDSLYAIVNRNPQKMMMVTNPNQLQEAVQKKKLGCMIGVEGGHMIEDNIANLDSLYKRGARYMTLTWNNSTSWATSAADESTMAPGTQRGLTPFGRQVVRRMNELGMMVDLSHVGVQTFWDAINTSTKPVIASHSSVYALCPVPRNLNDRQILAIANKGGVIDLNFYSGFLDSNYSLRQKKFNANHQHEIDSLKNLKWATYSIDEWMAKVYPAEANELRPPLSVLLDHLDYIVKLAGVDHVGIGSDFDGISSSPQQLDDVASFPLITKELLKRGYKKAAIDKILGGNFIRVFNACQEGTLQALPAVQ